MLAGAQSQLSKADREVKKYRSEMGDLHEQQTFLYASHVREVRALQHELKAAAQRAEAAEKAHAEDEVQIESWATMADALQSTGDEQQRKVAEMGRRLTKLRVREMELARQASVQRLELRDLRGARSTLQAEAAAGAAGGRRGDRAPRAREARPRRAPQPRDRGARRRGALRTATTSAARRSATCARTARSRSRRRARAGAQRRRRATRRRRPRWRSAAS